VVLMIDVAFILLSLLGLIQLDTVISKRTSSQFKSKHLNN
jgi:hypothetical protein